MFTIYCQNSTFAGTRQFLKISLVFTLSILFFVSCKKDTESTPKFGSCEAVAPQGQLTQASSAGPYTFITNAGGKIVINLESNIVITHSSYPGLKIEFWGNDGVGSASRFLGNHENLNGKHIKDRLGSRRTFIFPDGAKITMVAEGTEKPLISISIYDGVQSHHINATCSTLEHSSVDGELAQKLDEEEADGETGTIEFTPTGALFVNIYNEDTPGNKVANRILLGELFLNDPARVLDHYDDPRLGNT